MTQQQQNDGEPLAKHLTKGGPGDRSTPGNVNTEEWFVDLSKATQNNITLTEASGEKPLIKQALDKDIFFCTIPFTQVYSEIDGRYQACCFGKPDEKLTVTNTSLKDWMIDSDYMNNLRSEMLDPDSDLKTVKKNCTRCVSDENKYGRSRRTNCLKIHTNNPEFWDDIEQSVDRVKETGKFTFEERIIEIQLKIFGSECNIDCYMCTHQNSTTRMNQAKKGLWNTEVFGALPIVQEKWDLVTSDKTKGVVEQIIELGPYIRSIKIIGGEPLIMKKHYELLDVLIEGGHAEHIYLKYQTNLTKTKKGKHNIFKYLPHFRRVSMVASVDGIGPVIEYMRRRTEWKDLEFNITECGKYPNVDVDFNGLVGFLSVMRFYEVIDWCKDHPVIDQLNWAHIDSPKHLRANNLPRKIKDALIPKYQEWPDIVASLEMEADPDIDIQNVFDYLLMADKHYSKTKWKANLFDVFPELEEFYDPDAPRSTTQADLFAEWSKVDKEPVANIL